MAKKGKRYQKATKAIEEAGGGPFTLHEATQLLKTIAQAKFNESVDIDLRLGVDPRHADQMVRGTVTLPHGTGKEVRVLVLASEAKQDEAREAGADDADVPGGTLAGPASRQRAEGGRSGAAAEEISPGDGFSKTIL